MNCPNCNAEIKDGMKFCPKCGEEMSQIRYCQNCGTELKEGMRFCPKCGTSIANLRFKMKTNKWNSDDKSTTNILYDTSDQILLNKSSSSNQPQNSDDNNEQFNFIPMLAKSLILLIIGCIGITFVGLYHQCASPGNSSDNSTMADLDMKIKNEIIYYVTNEGYICTGVKINNQSINSNNQISVDFTVSVVVNNVGMHAEGHAIFYSNGTLDRVNYIGTPIRD